MKKNLYGNIEDIIQNIKIVTSIVSSKYSDAIYREPTLRETNGQESLQEQTSTMSLWDQRVTLVS